jgi:hypothetical protein
MWADVDALTDARDDEATLSSSFKDQTYDCEFQGQQGPDEDSMVDMMEKHNQAAVCRSVGMVICEMIQGAGVNDQGQSVQTDPFCRASNIPQVQACEVCSFIAKACQIAEWSPMCSVYALVLLTRMEHHGISLTWKNWDCRLLVALLIAQKMCDDIPLENAEFLVVWSMCAPNSAALTAVELSRLEFAFAKSICWDMHVTKEVYTQFLIELHSLHQEATLVEDERKMEREAALVEDENRTCVSILNNEQGELSALVDMGVRTKQARQDVPCMHELQRALKRRRKVSVQPLLLFTSEHIVS